MRHEHKTTTERLGAFSDAVIAVIITVMVLELKAPEDATTFSALLPLWPTAVSYLFIAIIWLNHHHLLRFVKHVTPALIWVNFAHLFFVSLVPFTTAWIARTHLASAPVALRVSRVRTAGVRSGRCFGDSRTGSARRTPSQGDVCPVSITSFNAY